MSGVFIVCLLGNYEVQEAILTFIAGGVVPGTAITLSPGMMLAVLGISLLLIIAWMRHTITTATLPALDNEVKHDATHPKRGTITSPAERRSLARSNA